MYIYLHFICKLSCTTKLFSCKYLNIWYFLKQSQKYSENNNNNNKKKKKKKKNFINVSKSLAYNVY